jgi:hypothetical protein
MRLPPFLRFLEPAIKAPEGRDGLKVVGHLLVERQFGAGPRETFYDSKNFIVDAGITAVRDLIIGVNGGGIAGSIHRMGVGDGGVPPGELFNPKLPDGTWPARTALYHEVIRQDVSVFSTPTDFSMRFVGSFNSTDVDAASFSLADRVINEAGLIVGDGVLTIGGDQKQINNGDTADADEQFAAMRTFKSLSFDPAEDVTVTITWTITIGS